MTRLQARAGYSKLAPDADQRVLRLMDIVNADADRCVAGKSNTKALNLINKVFELVGRRFLLGHSQPHWCTRWSIRTPSSLFEWRPGGRGGGGRTRGLSHVQRQHQLLLQACKNPSTPSTAFQGEGLPHWQYRADHVILRACKSFQFFNLRIRRNLPQQKSKLTQIAQRIC